MWAGVITHISKTLDKIFGKLAIKLFRSWHYKMEDLDPFVEEAKTNKTDRRWKISILKLIIPLIVMTVVGGFIALWAIYGTPTLSASEGASTTDLMTVFLTAVVGFGVLAHSTSAINAVR